MTRRAVALLAVGVVVVLAGCGGGPSEVPSDQLGGNASYDWDTNATVSFNLTKNSYTAIYNVSNRTSIEIYGHGTLGGEQPVDISALRFRFANGSVVTANHSALSVTRTSSRTNITVPARGGALAYTGSRNGKTFASPVFLDGSWSVRLPNSARVGVPLLSAVSPGGYDRSLADNRMTLRWGEVSGGAVNVRWYLELDFLLFATLFIAGIGLAVGGTLYYLRKIRRLEAVRKEIGLDVDQEDDDDPRDKGPPPGMR